MNPFNEQDDPTTIAAAQRDERDASARSSPTIDPQPERELLVEEAMTACMTQFGGFPPHRPLAR